MNTIDSILSIVHEFGHRSETWLYIQIIGVRKHKIYVLTIAYKNSIEYPYSLVTILPNTSTIISKLFKLPAYLLGEERPIIDPREKFLFSRIIKKEDIKCIQAHYGWTGYRYYKLSKCYLIPYIVWLYGSDVFRLNNKNIIKFLIDQHTIFCCTSNALHQEVIQMGSDPKRIYVFYPGVVINQYQHKREERSNLQDPLHILSVGRLCDFKDPIGMIRLAHLLKQRRVNFIWRHCGDGELKHVALSEINKYNLQDKFLLLGNVSNQQVINEIRMADILVHRGVISKDGGREALGYSLIEAGAWGLPIISNKVGGIPEVVQDGFNGFLLDEDDINGMAEKIELLANNFEL